MVELVTALRYPEQNAVNISCWQTSIIQIRNITVHAEGTSCGPNKCDLNSNETHTIEDNCNGENSCLVDNNFTSACLRGLRYMNLSYICKHGTKSITLFCFHCFTIFSSTMIKINMDYFSMYALRTSLPCIGCTHILVFRKNYIYQQILYRYDLKVFKPIDGP